ncbi:MAG: hypothetical protein A2161_02645 [Candidatus Schekmanbacteria bacterium RBG_13_48_7]|uniref:Glycosyltransferase RgtA/B/C/D-like domain-containing protein n=1 Tax=Candidatus Schekmanbacteria bacterium RBG_13_48_7 TaxID=1817878 RepID=A0A1F7S2X6_9BACT|nr:MAG: hypothetical protein A2161_02645 [Candidatus Schekmanbacteria bacterium RBG_13_48_7]
MDTDCLNFARSNKMIKPGIDLSFGPMGNRIHPFGFFQYFDSLNLRNLDNYEIFWRYDQQDAATFKKNPDETSGISMEHFGLNGRGGFKRFSGLNIDYSKYNRDEFLMEFDLVMPISFRLHMISSDTGRWNPYQADFYSGDYIFHLDRENEITQRYIIPTTMWRSLMFALNFLYLSNLFTAILFAAIIFLIIWVISFPLKFSQRINLLVKLTGFIKRIFQKLTFGLRWEAILIALIGFAAAWHIGNLVFHGIPRVNDEGIYLFQAKVFASGKWYVPLPEPRECFQHLGIWWEDRIFSYYTYGHSLILAAGFLIGNTAIIPPILMAITVLFTVLVGQNIYGSRIIGGLAGLLLITSPLVVLLGASYMSHISSMAANMLFLYLLIKLRNQEYRGLAVGAGVAWGLCFVIRPVTAVIFSFLPVLYWIFRKPTKKRICLIVLFGFCAMLAGSTAYYHAYKTTGHWELIQRQVENRFDTGNDRTTFWKNTLQNGMWFLLRAFGWPPYFTLMFMFLPFIFFSKNKWDWIFLIGFAANIILYSAIAHYGWTHEPRYFSEFMPVVCLLSIRGLQRMGEIFEHILNTSGTKCLTVLIGLFVLILLVFSSIKYYWPSEKLVFTNYCNVSDKTYEKIISINKHNSIVFLIGHPDYIYIPFFYLNSIYFNGDIIYAMDKGDEINKELMDKYPDRSVFRIGHINPLEQIR